LINFSAVRPGTLAGKIVRYPFRVLPRDIVVPILQGPLRGKKWIVGSHLHGCWLGSYEWEMQKGMAREIKPGTTFYDIGANVGFYSLLASELVGSGRVYAMEPLAANIAYLRRHLELNRVHNVEVMEMAISDEVGKLAFEPEGTRAMGRIGTGRKCACRKLHTELPAGRRQDCPAGLHQDGYRRRGVPGAWGGAGMFCAVPTQAVPSAARQGSA